VRDERAGTEMLLSKETTAGRNRGALSCSPVKEDGIKPTLTRDKKKAQRRCY